MDRDKRLGVLLCLSLPQHCSFECETKSRVYRIGLLRCVSEVHAQRLKHA